MPGRNTQPKPASAFTRAEDYEPVSAVMRTVMRSGLVSGRQMFWWRRPGHVNFGDWIGPLLYEWRTGRPPLWRYPMLKTLGFYYLSAGSTLNMPARAGRAVVWGSGFMWPDKPFPRPRRVLAVRGARSRDRLRAAGVSCPDVLGDPGILVPRALSLPTKAVTHRLGVVPNHLEMHDMARYRLTSADDVLLIDPQRDVWEVCEDIRACETIVSSSLHGLITAHAYGIPAAWISLGKLDDLGAFKYLDYYSAFGIDRDDLLHPFAEDTSTDEAIALARGAPAPDVEKNAEGLLAACPF